MLTNLGMSNTSDFVLKKEDHTLGNLLSEHLKMHPNVYMAGYKSKNKPIDSEAHPCILLTFCSSCSP